MSAHRVLQVTNARGDVIAEYPDFDPGQPVRVAPDRQGANLIEADSGYAFRGQSRHPQYAVIEHLRNRGTVEIERVRLSARD